MFDFAFAKIDAWVEPARQFDHPRRQIDADDLRLAACSRGCELPGSGRHLEEMRPRTQADRVEERRNGYSGDRREKLLVGRCQSIMALAFERAQLLCLAGRQFSCGHDRLSALRFELSATLLGCPP